MIQFAKKPEPKTTVEPAEESRFDTIRKAAAERHRKSDTDGARRRDRETIETNRLV